MARENHPCLTCNGKLPPGQEDFCSTVCKAKFHNRRASRGAKLYDLLMAALEQPSERTARFEARGAALMAKWLAEDKKAGLRRTTRSVMDIVYDSTYPNLDVEVFQLK